MLQTLKKHWFLFGLTVGISCGLFLGYSSSNAQVTSITGYLPPQRLTQLVLFLMAFSLNSGHLLNSFRYPGPVLLAALVNYGAIPAMGLLLMGVQFGVDFQIGLMIAVSTPCTMAAASVWTRKAGGNDAVSLLVTILTNGLCFVITPMWLSWGIGNKVSLDSSQMMMRLIYSVLLPVSCGQLVRILPMAARFADRYKTPMGVIAQSCVLCLVFAASCRGGLNLQQAGSFPGPGAILLVGMTCIGIHLLAMWFAWFLGGRCRFSQSDRIAMLFAGSQKTLPVGVLIATDPNLIGSPDFLGPGIGVPFAVFPMLIFHGSQLFIDTVIADRVRQRHDG